MFRFFLLVLLAAPASADLGNVIDGYAYAYTPSYMCCVVEETFMNQYGDLGVRFGGGGHDAKTFAIFTGPTSFDQDTLPLLWEVGGIFYVFDVYIDTDGDFYVDYGPWTDPLEYGAFIAVDHSRVALAPGQIYGDNGYNLAYVATPIPEPSSVFLFGFCLAACLRRVVVASRR